MSNKMFCVDIFYCSDCSSQS